MKRLLLLAVLLVAGLPMAAWADEIVLTYRFAAPLVQAGPDGTAAVTMAGTTTRAVAGEPALPLRTARVLLPPNSEVVSVTAQAADWFDWPGNVAVRQSASGFSLRGTAGPEIFGDYDPQRLIQVVTHTRLLGADVLLVNLYPARWSAAEARLSYTRSMELHVVTRPVRRVPAGLPYRGLPADIARIRDFVDNPDSLACYIAQAPKADPWDYLIVAPADLADAWQIFADYKATRFALATHVETIEDILAATSGDDPADQLRNFLRTAYADHGTQWVLLGGDANGDDPSAQAVPLRCLTARAETTVYDECIPGDVFFSNLDGTWDYNGNGLFGEIGDGEDGGELDLLAELYVGRVPADNAAQVARWLAKVQTYDDWAAPMNTLLIGELLWPIPPVYGDDLKNLAFAEMTGMTATRLYARDNSFSAEALLEAINSDSFQIVNASEHGNWYNVAGLTSINLGPVQNQLPLLTNEHPFFGYSHGCYSGAFDNRTVAHVYQERDCIVEEMLLTIDAGAFAFVTNSRDGFANWSDTGGASSEYDIAYMRALFGGTAAIGQALVEARETKIGELDGNAGANRWIFYDLNLLGDPQQPLQVSPGDDDTSDDDTDDDAASDDDVDDDMVDDDDIGPSADDDDNDSSGCGC